MKTVRLLLFVSAIALLAFGCGKGSQGVTGPTGAVGPTGANGYANVKNHVYSISNSNWIENIKHTLWYNTDTATTLITDTVQQTVTVFFSTNGVNGPWTAMPCLNALNLGDTLTYVWSPLSIEFVYKYFDATPKAVAPAQTMYFDVAVIPSAVTKRHPNTNWKDGNAVLKLPEVQAAMQMKN